VLEFPALPRETDDTCLLIPGTEDEPLPGKGDDIKSRQTLCHPLSPNHPNVRDKDIIDNVETSTPQHDTLKQEILQPTPSAPRR